MNKKEQKIKNGFSYEQNGWKYIYNNNLLIINKTYLYYK